MITQVQYSQMRPGQVRNYFHTAVNPSTSIINLAVLYIIILAKYQDAAQVGDSMTG